MDYQEWRQRWPEVVTCTQTDAALDYLRRYYADNEDGTPGYTGARFEAIAALNANPNTIGPADLVAVAMLSVKVKPQPTIRLLGPDGPIISELLCQLPADVDIVDADPTMLDSGSPAGELWRVLRRGGDGLGPTTTSKLLAAKRPRLLPIWDSFVQRATGLDTIDYWWKFQQVLSAEDRLIWNWLDGLRSYAANLPSTLSPLRVLDVLLWMSVRTGG